MKIPRGEKDSTRARRKAKKRKLQDAIPDLPCKSEVAVPSGSSKLTVESDCEPSKKRGRKYSAIHNAFRAQTEKPLKGIPKEGWEVKISKMATPDAEATKAGAIELDDPEQNSRSTQLENKQSSETEYVCGPQSENQSTPSTKPKKLHKSERKRAESLGHNIASATLIHKPGVASNENGRSGQPKRETRNDAAYSQAISSFENGFAENIEKKQARFIVFIGNLPFSTTTKSIKEHFAAVKPISVRHLTKKGESTQSKGCAFVEFEGYDHMKTCLRLYHHSTFDDGISPPRKINVELTAGGGGKTKYRQTKIYEKNQKLNEERIRRMREEERLKLVKRDMTTIGYYDVHPSRRDQVPSSL